ncbi:MAG: 16S rRNA (uracil(1498)-N(3))-methyltransferase [Candidatus Kapabacteria bacterium]|nr:16S rRNA (uracil(1498)-N(3))-methyltransferase [Candidatus Kapabacteria bacterium]MCS7169778.1 16S rRNA (uracil(1498)-N(3))-methyltransferase [Candidatus Kapabacteria bacterium]MDW7997649.1 RsmE family RNA methyltransferase [Bacteroidota bacterium]MDW8224804.1 RsmE family RNA methyltransferase [Bacteroidota bacterium]
MECLYVPELEPNQRVVQLSDPAELRHLRALRLRTGALVALSNGRGTLVVGKLQSHWRQPSQATFRIVGELDPGELPVRVGVALGVLQEGERLEFAVEKAVELGVREIVLLRTRYAQPQAVRLSRLQAKVLAALKQAQRAWMPELRGPMGLTECCATVFPAYQCHVVADALGSVPVLDQIRSVLVLVGPEGGWTVEELQMLQQYGAMVWSLGNRRLRSETAATVVLSLVGHFLRSSSLAQRA